MDRGATRTERHATRRDGPPLSSIGRRRATVLAALIAAGAVALLSLIPRVFHRWFYYWDDMMQSFVPQWRHLGERLLAGELPVLEPQAWMGGNPIAEAGYGVWNPVNLLDYLLAAKLDDLSLVGLVVAVQYLVLLAVAVVLLAREYGAAPWAAVIVGVAVPFGGFTLFYEATRWPGGLQAFTWVTLFWVVTRRYARARTNPLLPIIIGFLTITAGNPYGALGMMIVLLGVSVELWLVRHRRRIPSLIGVGAIAGSAGVLVFLPLLLSSNVGWRREGGIWNDGFLVPNIGDLLGGISTPSYQPDVQSWWGPIDPSPSTYLAFFILPLLPWLRFGAIARRGRQLASIWVVGVVYVALTLGASNVGMFRWPIRFIEYAYLAVAIAFAVLLSFGLARDRILGRSIASATIVAGGAYLAFAMRPGLYKWHIVVAVLVLVLVLLTVRSLRLSKTRLAAVILIGGTAAMVAVQGWLFIRTNPAAPKDVAISAAQLESTASGYRGTVLFLLEPTKVVPDQARSGRLIYGNTVAVALPDTGMNRYTGLGFEAFSTALCMDYRGGVCPEAFDRLWQPYAPTGDETLADALGVETLVVADAYRAIGVRDIPSGWEIIDRDEDRVVLARTTPLESAGTVSVASNGLTVLGSERGTDGLSERVEVDGAGGALVFERLAWPGYQVTLDGEPVDYEIGAAGLLTVRVPEGPHEVALSYSTPGVVPGLAVLALGGLGAIAMTIGHVVRRRGRR